MSQPCSNMTIPCAHTHAAACRHETETEMSGDARATWLHASSEWLENTNRKLLADHEDLSDESGAMCTVIGDIASMPHFSKADGWSEGDMYGVSVGWVNNMASVQCPNGKDCFWKRSKYTSYEMSISSEDFADWVEDVRAIMATAKGCPSFLFTFRFVMVRGAVHVCCAWVLFVVQLNLERKGPTGLDAHSILQQ